ncbi:MAG: hypothetical protein J6S05_06460 [Bacteroidaceae bacterium]|nr:hypothetical protein [Bacteroidaceae bacterium]
MTAEQEKSALLIFTPRATRPQYTQCKYFSTSSNGGITKTIWQANLLSQNNSKPQEQQSNLPTNNKSNTLTINNMHRPQTATH